MRTNAESLIGVRVPGTREDLSKGVAIGSGIYLDEYTHIEAVRYPDGSDAMGLLCYAVDQRPARLDSNLAVAQKLSSAALASPSHQNRALPASFRLGARIAHPALHADPRRPHRYALGEALVLALPESAGNQRHSESPPSFPRPTNLPVRSRR